MAAKDHPAEQILSAVAWSILVFGNAHPTFTRKDAAAARFDVTEPSPSQLNTMSQYLDPLVALGLLSRRYGAKGRAEFSLTAAGQALVSAQPLAVQAAAAPATRDEAALVVVGESEALTALTQAVSLSEELRRRARSLRMGLAPQLAPPDDAGV